MSRDAQQRIADILDAIERCRRYAAHVDDADQGVLAEMAEDAIERNLQIIGEAANHLPNEITDAHPEIPWPQIRGFRNILVHEYVGVDLAVVEDVVASHLPAVESALRQHLAP
ncbi:HepT-like ribonuclease domain-containing protein [Nesterenkonia alba]|uniref:HepT-like ribonuclease domain-containing protein n=1 Tax=Nesterenkonia alba TaxID=515814 RepID=UPI0003B4C566|nr:HepT-like ribonuclease domain-containing protein [Nesterenkonia alba]